MGDDHCEKHEEHTTSIARVQESMRNGRILMSIIAPVAGAILLFMVKPYADILSNIQADLAAIKTTVQTSATNDAVQRLEIENLKRDVAEIKSRLK